MRVLNILRSEPDETVRWLIDETFLGTDVAESLIYRENVDYDDDDLVHRIFDSNYVVSWW